jgi:hypothetical protein
MSSLTILNDAQVKHILHGLSKEEVETLQKSLRHALYEYSTNSNNDKEECSFQQPERQQLDRKNGTTTLFMPSTSSSGIGMKGPNILPNPIESWTDSDIRKQSLL